MISLRIPYPAEDKVTRIAFLLAMLLPIGILLGSAAADVLLSLVGALFLASRVQKRDAAFLCIPWVKCCVLLWAYTIAQSFISPDLATSLTRGVSWIRFPLFALALSVWLLPGSAQKEFLLKVMTGVVIFTIAVTLTEFLSGIDIAAWGGGGPAGLRLTGPFTRPIAGIMLVWMAFPCLLAYLMRARRYRHRIYASLFYIAFMAAVMVSGERMAFLLSLLGSFLAVAFIPRLRRRMLIALPLALALLVSVLIFSPQLLERQVHSTQKALSGLGDTAYMQIWESAAEVIMQNPVFGVGMKQFRTACESPDIGAMDNLAQRCNIHPHNIYLEWWSETGTVGLGLFLLMLLCWFSGGLQVFRENRLNTLFLGLVVAMVLRLFPLATSTSFFANWGVGEFWLITGWYLAYLQPRPCGKPPVST